MGRPRVYPDEFRERAVRLLWEWREARGVTDGGLTPISQQLGLRRETLRRWSIEQEVDQGRRPGLTTDGSPTCPGAYPKEGGHTREPAILLRPDRRVSTAA
ncbi:MAG: hypothetical protein LC799_23010 [Actinobacteria bacterium]|nr:hypothetical protein [Actinomycetota bacterium]